MPNLAVYFSRLFPQSQEYEVFLCRFVKFPTFCRIIIGKNELKQRNFSGVGIYTYLFVCFLLVLLRTAAPGSAKPTMKFNVAVV